MRMPACSYILTMLYSSYQMLKFTHDHMTIAKTDKFIAIISLVALRGQIMTVKVHSGLCMKYSRWVMYTV